MEHGLRPPPIWMIKHHHASTSTSSEAAIATEASHDVWNANSCGSTTRRTKDGSSTQAPLVPHHCHCLPPQLDNSWTSLQASSKKAPSFQAYKEPGVPRFDFQSGPRATPGQRAGRHWRTSKQNLGDSWKHHNPGRGGGGVDQQPGRLRLGRVRQLTGQLERSSQVLEAELQAYEKLPPATNSSKIDIMELYAGHADISFLAHQYDLKALEPYDLIYGHDMNKDKYKRSWRQAQNWFSPLLVVVETECTFWNIFNENLNYAGKDRMHELEGLKHSCREEQLPLVKEGVQSCLRQIADGNYLLFETQRNQESGTFLKFKNWLHVTTSVSSSVMQVPAEHATATAIPF